MKSIVEEASSIAKAVDTAWQRAGMPSDFSVRVFELPQKNFFGFTVKPAKVGLFFQEAKAARKDRQPKATAKPRVKREQQKDTSKQKVKRDGDIWTQAMLDYAQQWLNGLLDGVSMKNAHFKLTPQKYHLKVAFSAPLFEHDEQNRQLYRSCSHLLLQALRNECKRPLKGYKVIFTHA